MAGRKFPYKNKEDFTELDDNKKCYYLARLYIRQDANKSSLPYTTRLFTCANYLKKQPEATLSVLYNYLTDNTHESLPIWKLLPKAILYDQQQRRKTSPKITYANFSEDMIDDIIKESGE